MKIHRQPFRNPTTPPPSCGDCAWRDLCGGLEGEDADKGCFSRCTERCREVPCDCVCPNSPIGLDLFLEEIGGDFCIPPSSFNGPSSDSPPPIYVSQIHHGGGRFSAFFEDWVSIKLRSIVNFDGSHIRLKFRNRDELCNALKISPSCKILLTCVEKDVLIERFWRSHRRGSLLSRLAELEFAAVTTPNYSFMRNVPRFQSLHAMSRIFRLIERMAEHEIPVVPHLNASTEVDWERWREVLLRFPEIKFVSMEFQTGLSSSSNIGKELGAKYIRRFAGTVTEINRPLHPIVIGGTGWMKQVYNVCGSFTLVDSTPFFKTVKRQRPTPNEGRSGGWRTSRTLAGECLSGRFQQHVRLQRQKIYRSLGLTESGTRLQPELVSVA